MTPLVADCRHNLELSITRLWEQCSLYTGLQQIRCLNLCYREWNVLAHMNRYTLTLPVSSKCQSYAIIIRFISSFKDRLKHSSVQDSLQSSVLLPVFLRWSHSPLSFSCLACTEIDRGNVLSTFQHGACLASSVRDHLNVRVFLTKVSNALLALSTRSSSNFIFPGSNSKRIVLPPNWK